MPVTKEQAQMLASLAVAARPTGARRWDAAGVVAAIGKVANLHLADVIRAVANAADDRTLETPGAIGNPSAPCWRQRNPDRPAPREASTGPWCQTCGRPGQPGTECAGHPFDQRSEKRDPDAMARIAQALKAEIQPMREPARKRAVADLERRDPRAAAARAGLPTTHARTAAGTNREAANAAEEA